MSPEPDGAPEGRLCIDLCSGLGGFSQAFVDAGWKVWRYDSDPAFKDVPRTVIEDITKPDWEQRYENGLRPLVVLASPPCERFSIAMPYWPQHGIGRALTIVGACLEVIVALKPKYWCLENPKGRLRWFLGAPPHSVKLSDYGHTQSTQGGKMRKPYKPTDLWGNIPFPLLQEIRTMDAQKGGTGFTREARAERARMPYGLSKAILEAVSSPDAPDKAETTA